MSHGREATNMSRWISFCERRRVVAMSVSVSAIRAGRVASTVAAGGDGSIDLAGERRASTQSFAMEVGGRS